MKKVNVLGLAVSFVGGFLGAGFVSGRELWQFFGSFGSKGIIGAALAAVLLGTFAFMAQKLACFFDSDKPEEIAVSFKSTASRNIFSFFEILFVFSVYVVMLAGAGSLFNRVFGFSSVISSMVFALLVSLVVVAGVNGLVRVFSVTVPLLVGVSLLMSVLTFSRGGIQSMSFEAAPVTNSLVANPFVSAFVFVSYNFFAAIGVIAPLGKSAKKSSMLIAGNICGTVLLFTIAASIIVSMLMTPAASDADIPMLTVAGNLGKPFFYVFAILISCGMFGASTVSVFAVSEYFSAHVKQGVQGRKKTAAIVAVTSLLGIAGSVFGFSNLINTVYPVFGYLGMFALGMLTFNFIRETVKKRKLQKQI